MLSAKIITYPSRREHIERFEETPGVAITTANFEQLLSERVVQWPWFVDMVTSELAILQAKQPNTTPVADCEGTRARLPRVLCRISKAGATYFNQARGNPLKNKAFEPFALDLDLATCFDQEHAESTIVVHFIQTAALTFVMVGWFGITPSPSFESEVKESSLMETPHRTITVHFLHSNSGRRQSVGSYFAGGAQISPARLSTAWKRAITHTPFTLIEEQFFVNTASKKRKESPVALPPPLRPRAATTATATTSRPPGPHEMILQELVKSMQSLSGAKTTPKTPNDWEAWLDLPNLVANHWNRAIADTLENMYSAIHGFPTSGESSDFTRRFHTCIAFALFLYPYQMWSTFRLYTLGYALLPPKLREMALELDATKFNERSIGVSSWIGLVTTIMVERVVLPTIRHTLRRLMVNLEEAPTDGASARFVQLYNDLQSFTKDQYGGAFLDLFGMPPINTQTGSSSTATTRQHNLNCEAFAKYIQVHVAHRSLSAPSPYSKSSNERPLLDECLIPLIARFPYVVLNKPIDDNHYGRSNRIKTNFTMTTVAKRTAAAAAAASKGNNDNADASITPTENIVIDIEDMGTQTAPACLRRVIRIYKDDSIRSVVYLDRKFLLSSLFAAFAYFSGATDTGKKWGKVPNPKHRQEVIHLTLEWFKTHSERRYVFIRDRKAYGKDIAEYIDLFAKKDEGSTFEQACACDPKRDQQLGTTKTSSKTTARPIGASSRSTVQCPHLEVNGIKLEYTGDERKQALIRCKKDMGYTEETMNLNYAPHPFDVWVDQTVRLAKSKLPRQPSARPQQNGRPL